MSDMLGPAMLGVSQAVGSFQFFLPKLSEIRKADTKNQPEFVADVRMGEIAAACITLGVGAIVSSLSGSPVPMYVAAFMVGFLITLYECVLRADRPLEPRKRLVVEVDNA